MAPLKAQHISIQNSLPAMGGSSLGGGLGGSLGGNADKQPVGKIAIISAVAFVLQMFLSPNIAIAGISPNFLLLALIPIAMMSSQRAATITGFILGLLFDLLGAGPVGAMALVMAIFGYCLSFLLSSIPVSSFGSWIVLVAVGAVIVNLVFCIVLSILGAEQAFFAAIVFKVLPWTLYDIVIAMILWPISRKINGGGKAKPLESRIQL